MICVLLYQKAVNNRSVRRCKFEKINQYSTSEKRRTKLSHIKVTKEDMRQSYQLKSTTSSLKIYPRLRRRSRPSDLGITAECSVTLSAR